MILISGKYRVTWHLLYIAAVKNCPHNARCGTPTAQNHEKGQMGPLSKPAQVAPRHNLCIESIKFTKSFGNPSFEGEGDAFLRESAKEMRAHGSLNTTPKN
jgi:hypothetical protein